MATGFLPVQAEVSGHYKEICSKKRVFCFGSESDCCTYTSPTWRENARFAPAEIDQHLPITLPVAVSHCRIARSFCTGLWPKVSSGIWRHSSHITVPILSWWLMNHLLVQVVQMRAVSIACIRIELLVDDLPFGDGWPASISCPHPHQVLWCDQIRRSTRQLWHEDIIHWKQLSFQSAGFRVALKEIRWSYPCKVKALKNEA